MLNPIISSIVYAVEALIYSAFFSRISEPRFCKWKCVLIGICFFEIGSIFNLFSKNTAIVNTIVIIPVIALFFSLCFHISPKIAILYSLLLDGLNFAIELIIIYAFSCLLAIPVKEYRDNLAILLMEALSCKSAFFLVCVVLSNCSAKTPARRIPTPFFIYPTCVTACLLTSAYIAFTEVQSQDGQAVLAATSGFLLLSLIFLFYTFQHEIEKDAILIKAQEENAHLKAEKEYYDILEKQNQNLMLYAHDTRKHLNAIRELSQDLRIDDYVAKLYGELTAYSKTCHSGNKLLDVMVNRYVLDCELKGISFEYNVQECPLLHLEDLDLVSILGNLMDNAITSAGKSSRKMISLTTSMKNTYNVIVLKNSCDHVPHSKGEQLFSTKENSRLHGYGLRNVKSTIKKYNGDLFWEYDQSQCIFSMTVILQIGRDSLQG